MAKAASVFAIAQPEKRLFISLLTRDISLADAILDLIDNSINAAMAPFASKLKTADDYQKLFSTRGLKPSTTIKISLSATQIVLQDDAIGISTATAKNHIFKFGRPTSRHDKTDRLSVYGIGLKRAMFKIGNIINMVSDHEKGGFSMSLNVPKWERAKEQPWKIPITARPAVKADKTGTTVTISKLHPDVKRRINDGVFIGQLTEKIRKTYGFFLGTIVTIKLGEQLIEAPDLNIGDNIAKGSFTQGQVSCAITAGIGTPDAKGNFPAERAGWSIFCNGRTVISADKSELTGWTGPPQLPLFQPKHRPFVGIVFFVSENPEELPWTTTKASVNQENVAWQEAKIRMIATGKEVTNVLDKRYDNDGTTLSKAEVKALSGSPVNMLAATTSASRSFSVARLHESPEMKVQYYALREHVDFIAEYLRRTNMGGSAVGRYTFDYFLRNRAKYEG